MTPLKSSTLKAASYDPREKVLHISFHSGATHSYHGVPQDIANKLFSADSPGGYFHQAIKNGGYETRKAK